MKLNRTSAIVSGLALAAGLAGCAPATPTESASDAGRRVRQATALIESRSDSTARGSARFTLSGHEITLRISVEGATPGAHALHIHDQGDCSAKDASSAGPHFNPTAENHGRWGHAPHHLGDIGNIEIGPDGTGSLSLTTDRWSMGTGEANDILGRSVILHAGIDDFTTQPTGNAGGRIGCGVINAG